MKLTYLITFFCLSISFATIAQDAKKQEPQLLKGPTAWRFEHIPLPLDFALDMPDYQGFEELRFAPGMFDTTSASYFSYAFALKIDNDVEGHKGLSKKDFQVFLDAYYKGLCKAVAGGKDFEIDIDQVKSKVKKGKKGFTYQGNIHFYDAFTNGQMVKLNMEIKKVEVKNCLDFYYIVLVSPSEKDAPIWEELHQIEKELKIEKCL